MLLRIWFTLVTGPKMPSTPLFLSVLFLAERAAKSSAVTSIPLPSAPVTVLPTTFTFDAPVKICSVSRIAIPENPGFTRTLRWMRIPSASPPTKIVDPKSSPSMSSFVRFATTCAFFTLKSATNVLSFRLRLFRMMMLLSCCVPAVAKRMPALMWFRKLFARTVIPSAPWSD